MIKNIYEVFDEINGADSVETAKAILMYNMNFGLRSVLRATYHPGIQFVIDKIPAYRKNDAPAGMGETTIHKEINRVYLFEKNNPRVDPNLSQERKELILTQILEALEAREAEIFANMLLKKQDVKYLSKEVIEEVFPDVFSN